MRGKDTTTRVASRLRAFTARAAGNVLERSISTGIVDHGSLQGLADDDHTQYLRTDGTRDVGGGLFPALPDSYDLGSTTKMWRKCWVSELDAVVFAKNTITLVGGWLVIGKNEGSLPADVAAAATQIDFGQAMTVGHFILFRAALKVEYMQIGALVSGTIYNVTRNLDGTGANDWAAGTPYAVLGATGDGRIELNAYDSPRISILRQGATYNAQTEMVRIGDLNGSFGIASELYGFGMGDYAAGNFLRFDPTNGLLLKTGGGVVSMDGTGVGIEVAGVLEDDRTYRLTASGVTIGGLSGVTSVISNSVNVYADAAGKIADVEIAAETTSSNQALVALGATNGSGNCTLLVTQSPDGTGVGIKGALEVGALWTTPDGADGDVRYSGQIKPYRNDTHYTGSVFVPLAEPLISTAWDGDARSTTGKSGMGLSAAFGTPAGIKAILAWVEIRDSGSAGTDCWFMMSPNNTAYSGVYVGLDGVPNDKKVRQLVTVPCAANGSAYYQILASGTGTMDVVIQIWGYWM